MKIFTPGDTIWYHNYQKGNKWETGLVVKQTGLVMYLIDNSHGISQKHVDQLCFAYVNADIDSNNDNLENTVDNGTQIEHESRLTISIKENESVSIYSTKYCPSNLSGSQTPQLSQPQDNRDKDSANINKRNPAPVLCHSKHIICYQSI